MKLDPKSLKVKMWLYFISFAAIILLTLWALQIIFFGNFYQSMKKNMIVESGKEIVELYDSGNYNYHDLIREYCFRDNLSLIICNEDGEPEFSFDSFGKRFDKNIISPTSIEGFNEMIVKLFNSNNDSISYLSDHNKMQMVVFGAILKTSEGDKYLYISSPLPSMDLTMSVLRNQLIIITVILFVLAFLIAFFIAQNLSKPVTRLTESAKKLAKGDRKVVFAKTGYTEINQLADTLNYATKEISRVDELQKELIANISHDLRTPLTIIKVYAEMIRDIDNKDKRDAQTNTIIEEVDRLTSLVNDILELSKIESSNMELIRTDFNMSKKLLEIMTRFNVLNEKQGYVFHNNIDEDVFVNADEKLIERVIYNLIGNAATYTGEDKSITVNLKKLQGHLRLEVTDTGKGIPKEKIEHIWERYYKIKEDHKRAVIGTGLGLSIVKNILMLHGAKFGVSSTPNVGSTFWFELETIS